MHSHRNGSRIDLGKTTAMPHKVSWHLVKAVDRRTKEPKLLLVGRARPDLERFLRASVIRSCQREELPAAWGN